MEKQHQINKYTSLLMTFLLITLAVKSNFNDFHLYFNFDKNEMSAIFIFKLNYIVMIWIAQRTNNKELTLICDINCYCKTIRN